MRRLRAASRQGHIPSDFALTVPHEPELEGEHITIDHVLQMTHVHQSRWRRIAHNPHRGKVQQYPHDPSRLPEKDPRPLDERYDGGRGCWRRFETAGAGPMAGRLRDVRTDCDKRRVGQSVL